MRRVAVVALLCALGTAAAAGSAAPSKWPPPQCPTANALVAYYFTDGTTFNDDLVIRRDAHASLCWGRHITSRSGRTNFVVARTTFSKLALQLRRIGTLGPPPPAPTQMDVPTKSLVYRGKTIPADGYPATAAGVRALHRAQSILDRMITVHAPH